MFYIDTFSRQAQKWSSYCPNDSHPEVHQGELHLIMMGLLMVMEDISRNLPDKAICMGEAPLVARKTRFSMVDGQNTLLSTLKTLDSIVDPLCPAPSFRGLARGQAGQTVFPATKVRDIYVHKVAGAQQPGAWLLLDQDTYGGQVWVSLYPCSNLLG